MKESTTALVQSRAAAATPTTPATAAEATRTEPAGDLEDDEDGWEPESEADASGLSEAEAAALPPPELAAAWVEAPPEPPAAEPAPLPEPEPPPEPEPAVTLGVPPDWPMAPVLSVTSNWMDLPATFLGGVKVKGELALVAVLMTPVCWPLSKVLTTRVKGPWPPDHLICMGTPVMMEVVGVVLGSRGGSVKGGRGWQKRE